MARSLTVMSILLGVAVIATGGGAAYLTMQNIDTYEQEVTRALEKANDSLHPQGMDISRQVIGTSLMGIKREEIYTFREMNEGQELFAIYQTATIEPFRAYGEFGLDNKTGVVAMFIGMMPEFINKQEGRWLFDPSSGLVTTTYKTGAVDKAMADGSKVKLSPMILTNTMETSGERKSVSDFRMDLISVESDVMGKARISGIRADGIGHEKNGLTFIDRLRYYVSDIQVDSPAVNVSMSNLKMESGQLVDKGVLSLLTDVGFSSLKVSSLDKDLSMDPTRLTLFVDGVDWASMQAALKAVDQLSTDGSDVGPSEAFAMLSDTFSTVPAKGLSVRLEALESSFILNDRGPANINASGDLLIKGGMNLASGDADMLMYEWPQRVSADLRFDGSRSLMQSPFAEYFVQLIDAGYIHQDGERLISDLKFKNGNLTANDLPLDNLLATQM